MRLEERKTVIVLGGDQEQGARIATALGISGMNVVIPFAGDSTCVNKVISDIEANGGIAIALFTDIHELSHLEALCNTTTRAFGKVDAVVCSLTWPDVMIPAVPAKFETLTIMIRMRELLRQLVLPPDSDRCS
ncbi:SDR family NAD(P)-dependent oxidoreductase [Ensifer sp. B1-9]|uniref:SDR family NAD(P)-dependent oxidoreductase n=1 Tax=Ensifer sp. B1-9 TaxID=3141455 RepID=UPI003D2528C0